MSNPNPVISAIIAAIGGETKARAVLGLPRVTPDLEDTRRRIEYYSKYIDAGVLAAFNDLKHPYVRRFRDRILDLLDMGRVVGCPDFEMVIVMKMVCEMQEANASYELMMATTGMDLD